MDDSEEHISDTAITDGAPLAMAGDLLMLVRGMTLMKDVPVGVLKRRASFNQDLKSLRPLDGISSVYLGYMLAASRPRLMSMVEQAGHGTGRLAMERLLSLPIWKPSASVQRRIVELLLLCDKALELNRELLSKKRTYKSGLMHQLLTGQKRFPHFKRNSWSTRRFDSLCEEVSDRNGGRLGADSVMGVIKGIGFQPMRERVRGKGAITRCKVVPPQGFAYNPMRLNIGSIAYNDLGREILVSPDYEVFRVRPEVAAPQFVNQLRYSSYWTNFMKRAGTGSVRVRIYFGDLARLSIPTPQVDEQKRIADVLELLDSEINQLVQFGELTKLQKRALLSSLLSGELSVVA